MCTAIQIINVAIIIITRKDNEISLSLKCRGEGARSGLKWRRIECNLDNMCFSLLFVLFQIMSGHYLDICAPSGSH